MIFATCIPTMAFYNRWILPLTELNIDSWEKAFELGLLTEKEYNMCQKTTDSFLIPTLKEFKAIQAERLGGIPR